MNGSAPRTYPLPVMRTLETFGRDLALARRRRRISQNSMAERIGISPVTVRRLERGDPNLSWGTIARALHILGALEGLGELLDTAKDEIGLSLANEPLPTRIRRKKFLSDSGAL